MKTIPSPLFDLTGQSALVIGGTSGLGREIALGLARAGADVVASSRRSDQVDAMAAAIEKEGRRTLRQTSDVLCRESLEGLHATVLKEFGKLDILVNSAGLTARLPTVD